MLTLKAALEEATAAIGRTDAQAIMAHLLGVNRAYLAAHPMRVLTETEDARVDTLVARRSLGHPVAWRVRNDYAAMAGAALGQPVVVGSPKSRIARDVRSIAHQLAGVPVTERDGWLPWRRRPALGAA